MSDLRKDIEKAINCHSAENGSDTPDFILAQYLTQCLKAFDSAVIAREAWYGRQSQECEPPADSIQSEDHPFPTEREFKTP